MQLVCDASDAVIIGSDSFAQEVHGRLGTPPSRFTVIPGAVDTSRFHPPPDGVAPPPTRLLYHGRVDRRKGVFELLDAFEMLRSAGRDVTLTLSGIGPDHDEAAARCVTIPAAEATGHIAYDDAPGLYRRHGLFVSPTHAEGFSNTILEAMATGLPIVSCDAVGVVDCLTHGHNGLLAKVRDPSGLAAQIARLLDDAPLRRRLAATALDEARTLYAWHAIARRIADVYDNVRDQPTHHDWDVPPLDASFAEPCRFRAEPHLL